jgi:hypothetical protein
MNTPKSEASSMLETLPEDSSFEDIQYHLFVLEKVRRGIERAGSEGAIAHEDVKARVAKWRSE